MANDREDFELWLRSKWDGDAMKAAQASFEKTKDKAKETDSALKDMGYSAEALKNQLTGLLAAGAVWDQFKEGFAQVAALEQAMNQLERAAKRNGENFDVVKGQIIGMADSLKKAAGVDDDAAIKKMSELYNATGDVANAMNLVALATDVAIGAGMDFAQANDLVRNAALGNVRSLKELNISIEGTGNKSKDADVALEAIRKNFGGAANDAKGLKVELNRLSEAYEDLRNNVVESSTPVLSKWLAFAKTWGTVLGSVADIAGEVTHGVFLMFMKTGDALGELLKGNVAGAKRAMKEAKRDADDMFDSIVQIAKQTSDKVDALWDGDAKKGGVKAGKPKNIVTGGGGDSPVAKEVNEWQKELDRWHQIQGEMQTRLMEEKLKAEREFEDNKLALKKWSAKEQARLEKQIDAERERQMDAQTRRILDEVRLRKQADQLNRQGAMDTANAAIGLAGAVFGDSKEIAIAQAVMNTYEGASKALAQGGIYGPILAAIVIAAGLAQVAKIQSTEPSTEGRGFDVPGYDAAARAGGRRWAMDMVGEFSGGVREGWSEGMGSFGRGGSVTTDNSRTYNLHFHGSGLMDASLTRDAKKLKRSLDVIDRTIDSQRTVARARRS